MPSGERGLVELGATLRRGGRTRDAQPPLREGLDLADRCGATPLAAGLRTVETHLTKSYVKLEIDGRDGLADALSEPSASR